MSQLGHTDSTLGTSGRIIPLTYTRSWGGTMSQPPPYPPQFAPAPPAPRPPRWGRFAVWTAALAAAAFAVGGGVAALTKDDGGDQVANPAACKTAMAANYRKAMADPQAPSASQPPACVGLSQATLQRIVGEVVSEYLDSDQAKRDMDKALQSATAQP